MSRLENCEKQNREMQQEMEKLENRCEQLLQELLNEKSKNGSKDMESNVLEQENHELKAYIDLLEDKLVCRNCSESLQNNSKSFHEVGKRQQQRLIPLD